VAAGVDDRWPREDDRVFHSTPSTATGRGDWLGGLLNEQMDASGLMYRRNRYYDPQTGRFTQEDPIGIAGGLNVYGYAAGDPVSYSDPYGLSPESGKDDDPRDLPKIINQLARVTRLTPGQVQRQLQSEDGLSLRAGTRLDFGGGTVLTAREGNVLRLSADGSTATGSGFEFAARGHSGSISRIEMDFHGPGEPTTVSLEGRTRRVIRFSGTITFGRGLEANPTACRFRGGPIVVTRC
jgi:RHS repeat-associated protein